MKQLWIIAGANGSGKSTFFNQRLSKYNLPFINADNIAKLLSPKTSLANSQRAQKMAIESCYQKLEASENFCYETVFSHASKIDIIQKAKSLRYEVNLVFIHLNLTMLNLARVIQRVNSGGHDVPPDKIKSRVPRTLENIKVAIALCNNVQILDNSSSENPFAVILTIKDKKITYQIDPLPKWASELILKT